MSRKVLVFLFLLMWLLITACNSHTERPPNPKELIKNGEQIFVEFCAECHQMDGTGWSTLYPQLAGNPVVMVNDPEPIIDTVLYGQASMMAFGDKLDDVQIASVLSYIRNSWGNQAPAVSPRLVH